MFCNKHNNVILWISRVRISIKYLSFWHFFSIFSNYSEKWLRNLTAQKYQLEPTFCVLLKYKNNSYDAPLLTEIVWTDTQKKRHTHFMVCTRHNGQSFILYKHIVWKLFFRPDCPSSANVPQTFCRSSKTKTDHTPDPVVFTSVSVWTFNITVVESWHV